MLNIELLCLVDSQVHTRQEYSWFNFVWLLNVSSWSSYMMHCELNRKSSQRASWALQPCGSICPCLLPRTIQRMPCFWHTKQKWKYVEDNLWIEWFGRVTSIAWMKDLWVRINTDIGTTEDRKFWLICTFSCRQPSDWLPEFVTWIY